MSAAVSKLKTEVDHVMSLKGQGDFEGAIAYAKKVANRYPGFAASNYVLGGLLIDTENYRGAIKCFKKALKADPSYDPAHLGMGISEEKLRNYPAAEKAFLKVLQRNPNSLPALFQLSRLYSIQERYGDSEPYLLRGLELNDQVADFHYYLALVRHDQLKHKECIQLLERATELNPQHQKSQLLLSKLYFYYGDSQRAIEQIESAIKSNEKSVELCELYANMLLELGLTEKALLANQKMLDLIGDDLRLLLSVIVCAHRLKRFALANECLERSLDIDPDDKDLFSLGLSIAQASSNFQNFKMYAEKLGGELQDLNKYHYTVEPLFFMYLFDDPTLIHNVARRFADDKAKYSLRRREAQKNRRSADGPTSVRTPASQHPRGGSDQRAMRVGFFTEDFRYHPVGHVFRDVSKYFHSETMESHVLSYCRSTGDEVETAIREHTSHWHGVDGMIDEEIAELVRNLDLDILIDCTGWTGNSRSFVLSDRLAPVQVSWLGYPGTMGADWIDYIVIDENTVPESFEGDFAENILRIDQFLLAREATIATDARSRTDYGLPEGKFVFNCYNNNMKISESMFDVWMDLLHQCEGSVLALSSSEDSRANLISEAERRGIGEDRLVFLGFVDTIEEHRQRCALTDVYLDTYPYGAHVTVLDMLYAGLPVVTLEGRTMSSRVAASALRYLGEPSTIASSQEEYLAIAKGLWADSQRRDRLRNTISSKISQDNPFSPRLYAAKFQELLLTLHVARDAGATAA